MRQSGMDISGRVMAWAMACVIVLMWACGSALAATDTGITGRASVGTGERLEFDQKKALAHLKELEERMFRLAEVTRESEPDDAARLLLAVRRAREELIVEQMSQVAVMLRSTDLPQSVEQQKMVLLKLEQLRELLTSADLDFRLKLERLRALREAMKKLSTAIKEEDRLKDLSDRLGQAGDPGKPTPATEGAKGDQEKNRRATDNVNAAVKELGLKAANEALGEAGESMKGAEGSLGQGKPSGAGGQQGEAAKNMRKAMNELANEEKKLIEEIKAQAKKVILENLQAMLEGQVKVREAVEARSVKAMEGQTEAVAAVKAQSPPQAKLASLAEETAKLAEETQFSVALPPAIESIQRRMTLLSIQLKAGQADSSVIGAQKRIEADITELLEALKDVPVTKSEAKPGECKSCGGSRNKLLSELRILRLLQVRVNEETIEVNRKIGNDLIAANPELRKLVEAVRSAQSRVQHAMDRLHRDSCPDCVKGE